MDPQRRADRPARRAHHRADLRPAGACGSTRRYREEALFRGYTVVDPPTVLTTHLTEVVKDNMAELLSYAETQKLLDDLRQANSRSWSPT